MNSIKAQLSMEYLAVISFVLILVIASFSYAMFLVQQQTTLNKAFNAALVLRNAINELHSLAPGSKKTIEVVLPAEVKRSYINGKYAGWIIGLGNTEVFAAYESDANVTGSLPTKEGLNYITMELLSSGIIQFGKALTLTPETTTKTVIQGTTERISFILSNESDETVTGITATISGDLINYAKIISYPSTLNANENANILVDLNVPIDANAQKIYGFLKIDSNNNFKAEALIVLNIPYILGSINVLTYEDESYTTLKNDFVVTQTVYYEARFYDDKNNLMPIEDFNVFAKDPSNAIQQQNLYQNSFNGIYRNTYVSDCQSASGTWKIQVDANSVNFVTQSHSFNLRGGKAAELFTLDWNTAYFIAAGTKLYYWTIANYSGCSNLVIDKVKLEWLNDKDDAKFNRLRLNGSIVWQGSANSGDIVDITNFTVPIYIEYLDNEIQWTKKMDNDSEDIRMTFIFDDNSTYVSNWYTP